MLCGNTAGEFIPPMVVYKSEHCYENRTTGDYNNTVYDCTTNRWFDFCMFQTWFFKQFRKHQEKQVVLIGDNLGSHFSSKNINPCVENNIIFICLPPKYHSFMPASRCCCFSFCKNRVERHFRHFETRVKKKRQKTHFPQCFES